MQQAALFAMLLWSRMAAVGAASRCAAGGKHPCTALHAARRLLHAS